MIILEEQYNYLIHKFNATNKIINFLKHSELAKKKKFYNTSTQSVAFIAMYIKLMN